MCDYLSRTSTGDLACNPGMYPDWELNLRPFGSQAHAQSTELYQPGLYIWILINDWKGFPYFTIIKIFVFSFSTFVFLFSHLNLCSVRNFFLTIPFIFFPIINASQFAECCLSNTCVFSPDYQVVTYFGVF